MSILHFLLSSRTGLLTSESNSWQFYCKCWKVVHMMQPTVIGFPRKAYVYKLMSILYNGTSYETVAFIELKFSEYTIGIKQTSKLLNLCFWGRLRVFGLGYVFLYRATCFCYLVVQDALNLGYVFSGGLRVFVSAYVFLGCYLVV